MTDKNETADELKLRLEAEMGAVLDRLEAAAFPVGSTESLFAKYAAIQGYARAYERLSHLDADYAARLEPFRPDMAFAIEKIVQNVVAMHDERTRGSRN